jgi:hypothetical protein
MSTDTHTAAHEELEDPDSLAAYRINDPREFRGHARQMAGSQQSPQQADAVEHDARGACTVHGILDRRLRCRPPALEDARQGVGGDTRHLDSHEHHEEVVGGCHQAHAERGSQHE